MLKAYMIHAGEPQDGAALVIAHSFKKAKVLGFNRASVCDGCEYTDVRGHLIIKDDWLKANAADQRMLELDMAHVIDAPPSCKRCELWFDELFDGYCESCADELEEERDGSV